MSDYSELSDYEINKQVAEWLNKCVQTPIYKEQRYVHVLTGYDIKVFDPCNNPADAWPIIVENRISIKTAGRFKGKSYPEDTWVACDDSGTFYQRDDNPLRAAMMVFLMMKEDNG